MQMLTLWFKYNDHRAVALLALDIYIWKAKLIKSNVANASASRNDKKKKKK